MMTKVFHASATISIQADVSLNAPARAGDSVRVKFYANTKRLGSRKNVWHDEMGPNPHSRDFQPIHIIPAGFVPVELDWNNPPVGTYVLTAKATWTNGLSAVSAPVGGESFEARPENPRWRRNWPVCFQTLTCRETKRPHPHPKPGAQTGRFNFSPDFR